MKKILVEKYGEYGVPFNLAKKLKCYKVGYLMPLKDISRLLTECKEKADSDLITLNNVMIVMELGNFDIEFTQYGMKDDDSELDTGFFCCANHKDLKEKYGNGWQSEGFSDLITEIDMFDSKNRLEELMYNSMIKFMKENKFAWSVEN